MTKWRGLAWGLLLLAALESNASWAEESSLKERFLGDGGSQWEITANQLSYAEKEGVYIAEGDVVIRRAGQVLSAQKAKYNERSGVVEVSGEVVLETNGDILRTEEAVFDLNTQQGKITKGRLFLQENHYYISGDEIEKTGPDTYLVKGCRITTCDGEKADWSITGSEVKVTIEGYGTVKNAVFRIRDFPAFYIPYAIFPAKTKRQTGLLSPRVGYSNRNGLDVDLPFFWAISDQTDATFYERFMGKRGLMQGLEFRYVAEEASKGTLLLDVLSDRVEKKDLSIPEEADLSPFPRTNETRYWLRGRVDQAFPLGVRARLDADFVSDQDYLKEFQGSLLGFQGRPDLAGAFGRPVEEIQSPTRRSALRLAHDGEGYSLQALGSYHQRPENPANDETPQPLGGLNLGILPRPLYGLPLFLKLNADYDYIWRETGRKGHRGSFTPALSYPLWLGPYLEVEPSVSYTGHRQWVDDPLNGGKDAYREGYDFQTRVSTVLERVFETGWGGARRLKHKVAPSLIYRYRAIEDQAWPRPWFEPIDAEGKLNQVTLSMDHFLDARKENEKGEISYAQWGTFNLSQTYDIEKAREDTEPSRKKRPFNPLVGILTLNAFHNLTLDAEARWDHYDEEISFADLAMELGFDRAGGRRDTYAVGYNYSGEGSESLNYGLHVNLLYGFSAGASMKRDLKLKESTESSAWLDYESQCWGVRLIAESLEEAKSVMIYFRLLGLGDIKAR